MGAPKRNAKREAIIEAGYALMARNGYERTSTAQICTAAGVSSGTFFHHFPTKVDLLLAILDSGLEYTGEALARIRPTLVVDARAALNEWCEHVLAEAADENLAGFDAVLGAVPHHPEIKAALGAEATLVHGFLTELSEAGQRQGVIRDDLASDRIATWLNILANGVLGHAVTEGSQSVAALRPELVDVVDRLVRPA